MPENNEAHFKKSLQQLKQERDKKHADEAAALTRKRQNELDNSWREAVSSYKEQEDIKKGQARDSMNQLWDEIQRKIEELNKMEGGAFVTRERVIYEILSLMELRLKFAYQKHLAGESVFMNTMDFLGELGLVKHLKNSVLKNALGISPETDIDIPLSQALGHGIDKYLNPKYLGDIPISQYKERRAEENQQNTLPKKLRYALSPQVTDAGTKLDLLVDAGDSDERHLLDSHKKNLFEQLIKEYFKQELLATGYILNDDDTICKANVNPREDISVEQFNAVACRVDEKLRSSNYFEQYRLEIDSELDSRTRMRP